ncbi:sugar transferase [Photobacterium swingsii]|uniref:sugar transferase n=1 Tax=Photobacterium swingsii TaxID=680026 RepID=UPI004067CF83
MQEQKNNISFMKKRLFDLLFSLVGIFFLWPLIVFGWLLSSLSTKSNGFFIQNRIGKDNKIIKVIKLKTMIDVTESVSSITALNEKRITKVGKLLRLTKLDELPQLINVILGDMSLVGPRPDVAGYVDLLSGSDALVSTLVPGITGLATIKFKNEECLLSNCKDPVYFNDQVIFPLKVKYNIDYATNWSILFDVELILQTIFQRGFFFGKITVIKDVKSCYDLLEQKC